MGSLPQGVTVPNKEVSPLLPNISTSDGSKGRGRHKPKAAAQDWKSSWSWGGLSLSGEMSPLPTNTTDRGAWDPA